MQSSLPKVLQQVLHDFQLSNLSNMMTDGEKEEMKDPSTYVTTTAGGGVTKVLGYYTEHDPNPPPKEKNKSNGKPGGKSWATDGIRMYNKLRLQVEKSRAADKKNAAEGSRGKFDILIGEIHDEKLGKLSENKKNNKRKRAPVEVDYEDDLMNGTDRSFFDELMGSVGQKENL